jgi:two-component system response regulator LytT
MPDLDGAALARVRQNFRDPPGVVFVTGYENPGLHASHVHADYLLKPVTSRTVSHSLAGIARHGTESETIDPGVTNHADAEATGDVIAVHMRAGGLRLLPRATILYIEADGDYQRVFSPEGRFLISASLSDLEQRWGDHGFVRVHRRYLVNIRQAHAIRRDTTGRAVVAFADGHEVPISRRHLADLYRRLTP